MLKAVPIIIKIYPSQIKFKIKKMTYNEILFNAIIK